MNELLEWELDWVESHKNSYECTSPANAVKGNIEKRYKIKELESQLATYKAEAERLKEALQLAVKLIDKAELMECALYREDIRKVREALNNKEPMEKEHE